ncbi:hypothetical protein [Aliarcobacter lanthieri]|uniref:hypothetical protein n=1 Tax=Aliarcobacter lanthieri TaxID=1355374 RepID=UPI003AB0FFBC
MKYLHFNKETKRLELVGKTKSEESEYQIFEVEDNFKWTKKVITDGKSIQMDITLDDFDIEAYRIKQIKAKAEEIITSKYSIIWQLNHPRGLEENKEAYVYIDKIRRISNEAEEQGLNLDEIDWELE